MALGGSIHVVDLETVQTVSSIALSEYHPSGDVCNVLVLSISFVELLSILSERFARSQSELRYLSWLEREILCDITV